MRKESRGNDRWAELYFRRIALMMSRFGGGCHPTLWRPVHRSEGERMAFGTRVVVDGAEGDTWMDSRLI